MNSQVHIVLYKESPFARILHENNYYADIDKYMGIIKTYNIDLAKTGQRKFIIKQVEDYNRLISTNMKHDKAFLSKVQPNTKNYIWLSPKYIDKYLIVDITKGCESSYWVNLDDTKCLVPDYIMQFISNRENNLLFMNSYFN